MNIFEKASRSGVRFELPGVMSNITTEDLWNLKLTGNTKVTLDKLAKTVNRQLRESEEESFVTDATPANTILKLKMDILKHVIEVKKEEEKAREESARKVAQRQQVLQIIAEKENETLKGMSLEELKKLV